MLDEIQKWFGTLISQPLQPCHTLPSLSPFRTESQQEASKYIAPSPTLKPHQRLEIYHQQYWWRLLKCLQNNFPMVTRLFGIASFHNQLAIPYLSQHPPDHWALYRLGESFPLWLQENYQEKDRYLVITAAQIDWATGQAFWLKSLPPVDFASLSPQEQLAKHLIVQPHLHLFALKADFFNFRELVVKEEPDYYQTNPFPEMRYELCHFVLYRTSKNVITWRELGQSEYEVLLLFKKGCSIEKACAEIEQRGGALLEEALSLIPIWFKQWTVFQWFGQF